MISRLNNCKMSVSISKETATLQIIKSENYVRLNIYPTCKGLNGGRGVHMSVVG